MKEDNMIEERVSQPRGKIIVVGNEKGGTGKTTVSMHLIISLLSNGYSVSSIDLDARQRTLTGYIENRLNYAQNNNVKLTLPQHFVVNRSRLDSQKEAKEDEEKRFVGCLDKAASNNDFVIIDSPGNDTYLSRLAHSFADTIITPINDSFLDLDVLAKISDSNLKIDLPGIYSEVIWEAKISHAKRDGGMVDWVVLRNRLTNIDARNKRNMATALSHFEQRMGCKIAEGFCERVIYRELFLKGLTLLDTLNPNIKLDVGLAHIAARQELRNFLNFLGLDTKKEVEITPPQPVNQNINEPQFANSFEEAKNNIAKKQATAKKQSPTIAKPPAFVPTPAEKETVVAFNDNAHKQRPVKPTAPTTPKKAVS